MITGRPPYKIRSLLNLPMTAPAAWTMESEKSLLLLTDHGVLMRLMLTGKVEKLGELPLDGLMPSSMVLSHPGELIVGMRHYVAQIQFNEKKIQKVNWLLPPNCKKFSLQGYTCKCTPPS